jgi:hypothetical protein
VPDLLIAAGAGAHWRNSAYVDKDFNLIANVRESA